MSGCKSDLCLSCSKKVRIHQKDISCKVCHLLIHKKCTKLIRKDIIRLNVNGYTCMKCISANTSGEKNQKDDTVHDFNASEGKTSTCSESINANFSKYDKMIFNPFKYQNDIIDIDAANAVNSKCMYVTPEELRANQGRSQPHSPGWARVPLSSFFLKISINFSYFFLKLYLFSSSFWSSGWASRPPGKALATPLGQTLHLKVTIFQFLMLILEV